MTFTYSVDGSYSYDDDFCCSWAWVESRSGRSDSGSIHPSSTYLTSVRMEMYALLEALCDAVAVMNKRDAVYIYSDCYSVVEKCNEMLKEFYAGRDTLKANTVDSDLWLEILSEAVVINQLGDLRVQWVRRNNKAAHNLADKARFLQVA